MRRQVAVARREGVGKHFTIILKVGKKYVGRYAAYSIYRVLSRGRRSAVHTILFLTVSIINGRNEIQIERNNCRR